ncbi:hypothetical protein MOC30_14150 [Bacillus spizizenii]|nr:hypothetical protein [Bacillus spizizenii]
MRKLLNFVVGFIFCTAVTLLASLALGYYSNAYIAFSIVSATEMVYYGILIACVYIGGKLIIDIVHDIVIEVKKARSKRCLEKSQ